MTATLKKYKTIIIIAVIATAVGYGFGKFANPSKVITKTEFKEIIREVEVKKEQKNIVTYTKKTTKKDGTIIEEKREQDRSTLYQDSKKESKTELASSNVTVRDIGLSVHVVGMKSLQYTERQLEYGVFVKKRVFGNVSVGGLVTDQRTVGVSVGLDF